MKSAFLQQGIPKEDQIMSAAKQVSDKKGGYDPYDVDSPVEEGHSGKEFVGTSRSLDSSKKRLIKEARKLWETTPSSQNNPSSSARRDIFIKGDTSVENLSKLNEADRKKLDLKATGGIGARIPGGVGNVIRSQQRRAGIDPDKKGGPNMMKGSPAKQGIGHLEKMTDRINRDKAKGKGKK